MSATIEVDLGLTGLTLTCDLFPDGSDTAAASSVALTEATNRKGLYTATVSVTGVHKVKLYSGAAYFPATLWADITSSGTVTTVSDRSTIDVSQVVRADDRDGDAIPTAAQIRDVSNASPAANSLGAAVNEAAGSATNAASYASTALSRLGAITGSGVNTVLGFFKGLYRTDATLPSDIGGTMDPTTDSLPALRDAVSAAGDPLENAVPGTYADGTAGHSLGTYLDRSISSVISAIDGVSGSAACDSVRPGARLTIKRGDDYYTADGFPVSVVISDVADDLPVESVTVYLFRGGVRVYATTTDFEIVDGELTARADFGRDKTQQLVAGDGKWSAQIALTGGHYREPIEGPMLVTERVGPVP